VKMQFSDSLSDGSIEIFCDALQLIVYSPQILNTSHVKSFQVGEGESGSLRGTMLVDKKVVSAKHHASELLRLLCASRFFSPEQKGFADLFDLERWILKYNCMERFATCFGPVPSWVMGHANIEEESRQPFLHLTDSRGCSSQNCRTLE